MSKFAAYSEWTVTVRKCLDGEIPPPHLGDFHLSKTWIKTPIPGIEHSTRLAHFYQGLHDKVNQYKMDEKRNELYKKFQNKVIMAHVALEQIPISFVQVSRFRIPIAHLDAALKLMNELKEYDDENPVHWSEVFPTQNTRSNISAEELWLYFKLESLRPSLVFLVRLFKLILPKCESLWKECEDSLLAKEWINQFILDSPVPSEAPIPTKLLKRLISQQNANTNAWSTKRRWSRDWQKPSGLDTPPDDGIGENTIQKSIEVGM